MGDPKDFIPWTLKVQFLLQRILAWWFWAPRDAHNAPGEAMDPTTVPAIFHVWDEWAKQISLRLTAPFVNEWHTTQARRLQAETRLVEIDEKIVRLKCDAEGLRCLLPSVSHRLYIWLLILIAAGESAFSFGSFLFSGIDVVWADFVLAVISTTVILLVAHDAGRKWRSLPLPRNASSTDGLRLRAEIVLEITFLSCLLLGISKLRALGLQSEHSPARWVLPVFAIIGGVLALAAMILAAETEYSGPLRGLAKLERQRESTLDLHLEVRSEQDAIAAKKASIQQVVDAALKRLKGCYLYAYQRARAKRIRREKPKPPIFRPPSETSSRLDNFEKDPAQPTGGRWMMSAVSKWKKFTAAVGGILLAAVAVVSLLTAGCNGPAQTAQRSGAFLDALVDDSRSMHQSRRDDLYRYFHRQVVPTLSPGERILVETVAGHETLADPRRIADMILPDIPQFSLARAGLFQNPRLVEENCTQHYPSAWAAYRKSLQALDHRVQAFFETPPASNSTFLIDGIDEAADEFAQYKSRRNLLLVMSDGLADSTDYQGFHYDFANMRFWAQHSASHLINRLKKQGRIPRLDAVAVYFVGAAGETSVAYLDSRDFWRQFFEAAGVTNLSYGHWPLFTAPKAQISMQERCGR